MEPSALVMYWTSWKTVQEEFDEATSPGTKIGTKKVVEITEKDVFQMGPSEMEDYMDCYQKTWLETDRRFAKGKQKLF